MLPPVAVCGLARNLGPSIVGSLAAFDRICAASSDGRAVIVTNDNVDGTASHLSAWQASAPRQRTVYVVDGLSDAIPHRIERLAVARNFYLLDVVRMERAPELVVVMDLDGLNAGIEARAIASAIAGAPGRWGGLFANQNGPYYDLYALRRRGWVTNDIWHEFDAATRWMRTLPMRAINRLTGHTLVSSLCRLARRRIVSNRQYLIPPNHPPIEVDSAFGGLAIYRRDALTGVWYGSRDGKGISICEHTVLHHQLRSRGVRLYIVPSLLNATPPEHVDAASGLPLPREVAPE